MPETLNHQPRAAVHRNAAIFQVVWASGHILLSQKLHDDISNGSRVTTLTHTPRRGHYWRQEV